jgi:hypothetical protein
MRADSGAALLLRDNAKIVAGALLAPSLVRRVRMSPTRADCMLRAAMARSLLEADKCSIFVAVHTIASEIAGKDP